MKGKNSRVLEILKQLGASAPEEPVPEDGEEPAPEESPLPQPGDDLYVVPPETVSSVEEVPGEDGGVDEPAFVNTVAKVRKRRPKVGSIA
jgi:hypothetical protein